MEVFRFARCVIPETRVEMRLSPFGWTYLHPQTSKNPALDVLTTGAVLTFFWGHTKRLGGRLRRFGATSCGRLVLLARWDVLYDFASQ